MSEKKTSEDCLYSTRDNKCRAVRQETTTVPRDELCRNPTKDECCYTCRDRESCVISCDMPESNLNLPENIGTHIEKVDSQNRFSVNWSCGCCMLYLKPECPRKYPSDQELWRRQDPCEQYEPA